MLLSIHLNSVFLLFFVVYVCVCSIKGLQLNNVSCYFEPHTQILISFVLTWDIFQHQTCILGYLDVYTLKKQ